MSQAAITREPSADHQPGPLVGRVPPHDLDAEAVVISACLLDYQDAIPRVREILRPEHCYSHANRLILEAAFDLYEQHHPVDLVAIGRVLRDAGKLNQVGGTQYISQLCDATIAVAHVEEHARTVYAKWRARAVIQLCQRQAAEGYGHADPDKLVTELATGIEALGRPSRRELVKPLSNVDLCEAIMGAGPRIPLGVQPLDDKLHGGMRIRKLFGIGGAPGSWKTSFLVQIGDHLCAQSGIAVAWVAYDECAEEILSRRLQARGVERFKAENPDEETLMVARELDELPFHVFEHKPFDEVIESFARMYPNHDRFVVIDSAQKMWTRESRQLTTLRERLDLCLDTARKLAESRATQCAIFFTSEVGRESYRNRAQSEQINDLAAGKESGSIEYGMDVWSVLRCVPGDPETITMSMPKCRIGTKLLADETFEFIPDKVHVRLRALGSDAREDLHRQAAADQLAKARAKMLKALRDNPSGLSTEDWRYESKVRKQDFGRASRKLLEDKVVTQEVTGRSHKTIWRIA